MTRVRRLLVGVALTMTASAVAGCGGSDSSATGSGPPASVDVRVVLHDQGSPDLLFDLGGGRCTSVNVGQAPSGGHSAPVRVELRDASGNLVGSGRLPKTGGSFSKSGGCTWPVRFDSIPPGSLFQGEVSNGTSTFKGSGPPSNVTITF